MSRGLSDSDAVKLRALVLALVPACVILAVTVVAWQRAVRSESDMLAALSQSELGWVMADIERSLDRHSDAITAMAKSSATQAPPTLQESAAFAMADGNPFRAVARLDTSLTVVESAPLEARMLPAFSPDDDAARRTALLDAIEKGTVGGVVVTPSIDLADRGRQIVIAAPMGSPGQPAGYVMGVVRLRDLFDTALERTRKKGFEVTVGEAGAPLYGPTDPELLPGSRYAREAAITNGAVFWSVRLWPSQDVLRRLTSWGPLSVLVLGTLLGFLAGILILVWLEQGERGEHMAPVPDADGAARGVRLETSESVISAKDPA